MPPKKRPAEHDSDPRPSKAPRLSDDSAQPAHAVSPPSTPTRVKRALDDGDVNDRPAKMPRLSPDWPDPLQHSSPSSPPGISNPLPSSSPPTAQSSQGTTADGHLSPAPGSPTHTGSPDAATYDNIPFPPHLNDETLKARLLDELRFVDADKSRYNIGLFPSDSRWGVVNGRNLNFDRYLCTSAKPGVVRIIGTIRFIQTKNERLNVGVEPLAPADTASARSIQNGKARPPRSPSKSSLVYASKFLNGDVFAEAYDATDFLLPWPDMQDFKIPFRRIRATDTVVLECLIRRYPPPNAPYGSGWDKFSIAFELTRIARIAVGPGVPDYLPD